MVCAGIERRSRATEISWQVAEKSSGGRAAGRVPTSRSDAAGPGPIPAPTIPKATRLGIAPPVEGCGSPATFLTSGWRCPCLSLSEVPFLHSTVQASLREAFSTGHDKETGPFMSMMMVGSERVSSIVTELAGLHVTAGVLVEDLSEQRVIVICDFKRVLQFLVNHRSSALSASLWRSKFSTLHAAGIYNSFTRIPARVEIFGKE
ncbi:hypothetical protein MRX96_047241 [Rhipicephalus microplus]